jgi:hypothetical protein
MGSLRLPRTIFRLGLCLVAAIASAPPGLHAQDIQATQAPAHIAFVDGRASLEREGQTEQAAAGTPLVPGDRLRTDNGRLEILFPDGSALDVDEYASVDLQSPTLLRVTAGRVMLTVAGANNPSAAIRYQIDTPAASAMTDGPGEFRVALLSGPSGLEIELAVLRGTAALTTERGTMPVRAGERSLVRDNEAPMRPQAFNSARFDAFDLWSATRRSARMGNATSARYLPSDLQMYGGTLDRYGAWQYQAQYGYVWYPTVAVDWRPYYDGYWSSVRPYGWTWIGLDLWAWPTHHYGRWGLAQDRWFWIPGRHWGAAWVSWGAAPGYVSWCPLDFYNRPVFDLSLTAGNPWAEWVVVPRTHFGGSYVREWAIPPHQLPAATPFVVQASAPVPPMRAIPRPNVLAASPAAHVAIPRAAMGGGIQQPAAAIRQPVAGSRQLPVGSQHSPFGSQPSAAGNQVPTDRSWRSAVPRQPTAIERRPSQAATGPPTADRGQVSVDRRPPTADRSLPVVDYRQRPDTWLKQPLPEGPRTHQRNPGASERNPGAPAAPSGAPGPSLYRQAPDPSPYRQAVPRWGPAGSASSSAPAWQPTAPPQPSQAPFASPRTAVPRMESSSWDRMPVRSEPAPQREFAPPPQAARPAPAPAAPATAVPRSGPPAAAAPSAASPRSSSGAGAGGAEHGHGARHP